MPEIKITHEIEVDKCIEKEISELNNKYGVLTLHSCCGHEKGEHGFVAVHPDNIITMLALGYEQKGSYKTQGYQMPTFTAKSKCKGRCD